MSELGISRATPAQSKGVIPLGWPDDQTRLAIVSGIDTQWPFELVTKVLPPQRILREMYGRWRIPNTAGSVKPYTYIPALQQDAYSRDHLDRLYPKREWWCPLTGLAFTLGELTQVVISTRLLTRGVNAIFKGTYSASDGEEGLRQALVEFAHGIGAGP